MAQRRTASPNVDIERAHRKERSHRRGLARTNEGDRGPARSPGTPTLPEAHSSRPTPGRCAVSERRRVSGDCTPSWRACARFFRARARLTRRVLRATREGRPAWAVCVLRRWWCCLF